MNLLTIYVSSTAPLRHSHRNWSISGELYTEQLYTCSPGTRGNGVHRSVLDDACKCLNAMPCHCAYTDHMRGTDTCMSYAENRYSYRKADINNYKQGDLYEAPRTHRGALCTTIIQHGGG